MFSERSKYIIVLNSCFTLNHRGKKRFKPTVQPSIPVQCGYIIPDVMILLWRTGKRDFRYYFLSLHIECIVFHFNAWSHWPVKRVCCRFLISHNIIQIVILLFILYFRQQWRRADLVFERPEIFPAVQNKYILFSTRA